MEKVARLHAFDLEGFCKTHGIEIPSINKRIPTFRKIVDATWARITEIPYDNIITDR